MEIKTIPSVLVASVTLKTTLEQLCDVVGVIPQSIANELSQQSIKIVGPQVWEYWGCDGTPSKEFTLKIAFPVEKVGTNKNELKFEQLQEFKCVSKTHNGGWDEFKDVYAKLFEDMFKKNYQMNGYNREVYINCDFENNSNCVTELQIGIV